MDREISLFEINGLHVRITLGMILNIVATLISLGILYGKFTSELSEQTKRIEVLERDGRDRTEQVIQLRNELSITLQKLTDFQSDYERDANRYIRDYNDRRVKP